MRNLFIATGSKVSSPIWTNEEVTWEELCERLSKTIYTSETADQYKSLAKKLKTDAKDHGGFVGGKVKDRKRNIENIEFRSMLTLDCDHAKTTFLERFLSTCAYECCLYSTHGHTEDSPRFRIIVPLTRDVNADEYNAISRYFAGIFGIEQFDRVSFTPNQLMFWPSTPKDVEYIHQRVYKEWLDPDAFLAAHPEWKDIDSLPHQMAEHELFKGEIKCKQTNPHIKPGIVGAFNRVFTITNAIHTFLSDIYDEGENGRFHYIPSDSVAGAIVYEDKFIYSHHASDPACGKCLNAFDLVKLHKFQDDPDAYNKMRQLALGYDEVRLELSAAKEKSAIDDFSNADDTDVSWKSQLEFDKDGVIIASLRNMITIMNNDANLQNIKYNELASMTQVTGQVPWNRPLDHKFWREFDESQLKVYLTNHYADFSERVYSTGFQKVMDDRRFHPVRDYLDALPKWDGVKRIEDFFIKYLQADDNDYTREVTRKWFAAGIARVYHPGTKFDAILVLDGKQGVGKSTLIKSIVDPDFYSDSLQLSDMDDNKKAGEKVQGFWIIEIQELAGMKKADIEKVKGFISSTDDKYRPSYGHVVEWHPRQCVIFSTVNGERGYLRDLTGNRRFWVININATSEEHNWTFTQEDKDQLWAEAKYYYEQGEKLYLTGEHLQTSKEYQNKAMEHDDRTGLVEQYLNTKLPKNWYTRTLVQRRDYFHSDYLDHERDNIVDGILRDEVTNIEIWCECLGKDESDFTPLFATSIAMIMAQIPGWEKSNKIKSFGPYSKQRYYSRKK